MTVTILPASSAIQPGDRKDVSLPPDKSILHRVLILGSLTTSGFVIKSSTLDFPEDIRSTISILRQLGVTIEISDSVITLHGVGLRGFTGSNSPLDCGNSGTTARLMMAIIRFCAHR
jgi:3-phosphoshikimate 1-carboxyvinyltransferase